MLKWFLCIFLVSAITPLGYLAGMNYRGYCWGEERILSDQELIDRLVEAKYLNWPYIRDSRIKRDAERIGETFSSRMPYETVQEFHQENPDCCSVLAPGRESKRFHTKNGFFDPSTWMRITGHAHANVIDRHNIRFLNRKLETRYLYSDGSFWVTSCGKPVQPSIEFLP